MFTYVLNSSRKKNREYRKLFRKIGEFDTAVKVSSNWKIKVRKETNMFFFLNYVMIHYLCNELTFPMYFFFKRNEIILNTDELNVTKEYVEKILNLAVEAVKEYLEQKEKEKTPIYL